MERAVSFLGVFVMLGLAWLLSVNRKKIDYRLVAAGIVLQFVLAISILWTTPGKVFFDTARNVIFRVMSFSESGSAMVFGEGFKEHFFAFAVLPTIIFFSSLMSVFFYLGIIQKIVKGMAWVIVKVMKVSGAESLAASANVFIGQTEAPLVIKPYIKIMTRSEIMAMMTGGMATIAGGVMAAYVGFGADPGHLLAASIMAAPGSLVLAKIVVPETEVPKTRGQVKVDIKVEDENVLDAACRGASEGLYLSLNIGAMLIAFVAFTALLNFLMSSLPDIGGTPLSFERVLGWIFAPIAFVMGIEGKDCTNVGMLLGKKMFLNEFLAYMDLRSIKDSISERSFVIATYALCGFANFSSIAIQIGGIGNLVPSRRKDFAQLGLRAMLAGSLAAFLNATIAGILIE